MHILHVAAHLGGGVGKAHASLVAVMPRDIKQTFLLLEEPRDRRYADEIEDHGAQVVIARDLDHVAALCAEADIVQFEFWNHPRMLGCLAQTDFPPMRTAFWAHVSGLFTPIIPLGLMEHADRFVFTTPASMVLAKDFPAAQRKRISSIGSGFGFSNAAAASGPHDIAYLGTVDFIKLHPGLFDAIDALPEETAVAIWGTHNPNGDVAAKAASMRHPDRVHFMGQTEDPQHALAQSRIFFYPLQPDHYGTAENALIEAMSMRLVPVVLDNPAERTIVQHGKTGFICKTISECTDILGMLLNSPALLDEIGGNAARQVAKTHTPLVSAKKFADLWSGLLAEDKHMHDFRPAIGLTPLDWYYATQGQGVNVSSDGKMQSKGTLAHFRSTFPDDPCWQDIPQAW